jgi:serine/threonine protein phosphatase PrpC
VSLSLRFAALSDVGRVRRDNQDSGYVGAHLLVIADGVGGAARGDIASSATVEALRKLDVPPGNDALSELAATIHLAHDRLAEIVEAHPDLDGTSTTVSAAIFDGTHLRIGHVGDSRAYLLRDGVLDQLTSDHTLVQSLVDEGRITEAEARVHPHRNLILRAVDGVHEPEPDLFSVELQAGDRLLFCSDGCSGALEPDVLATLLGGDGLEHVAAQLVTSSLDAGSSDNVTVVLAAVVEDGAADAPAADAPAAHPLIVGAAALNPHLLIASESTGNLSDSDVVQLSAEPEPIDPEAIRYAPQPPPRGLWLRRLLLTVVVLGLIAGAGFGAYRFSQNGYYVTEENGHIAVFKGVNIDLPVVKMHTLVRSTDFTLEDMGEFSDEVRDGKDFPSLALAMGFVLQAACPATDTGAATPTQDADKSFLEQLLPPIGPPSTTPDTSVSGASCAGAP